MKFEIAPQARLDLIEIGDYLERVAGKRTARRWVERIQAKARRLAHQPYAGAADAELGGRRRIVVGPYLVVYWATSDVVRIVRIVHGARDLPPLFPSDDA